MNRRSIEVFIKRQTYVVDNLKAKMLIDINIITSKDINLVILERIEYINSY